ncbi:MAG: carbohydrate ABC transporter permease [Chloroflexota bacterium]
MTASAATAAAAARADEARPVGDSSFRWRRRLAYVLLIGYALLMFVPFAWSVLTSFKTLPDSVSGNILPQPWTLDGWEFALTKLKPSLPAMFLNSAIIAGVVTVTNLVLGSLAGYAFARLHFPGREALFIIVLATLMMPDQLRLVPVYLMLHAVGLTSGMGQYLGVILISAVIGTSIFLIRQYFLTIPRELEEAARIDGAGFVTTFLKVMLPLAGPALAAVAILTFQGTWNAFFWPLILLQDLNHYTLPIGLMSFRFAGGMANDWPPLMATVVMATIPIVVLYVFFQRYFVEGIAATGLKG